MTATELVALIIIGLFLAVFAVIGAAVVIGLVVLWLGRDDPQSSYDFPAVIPENWK